MLPGDLALSGIEDLLSTEWLSCPSTPDLSRSFRVTTAFWQVMQAGARKCGADRVLVDVGPGLRAINDFRRLVMEILDRKAAEPEDRQSDSQVLVPKE